MFKVTVLILSVTSAVFLQQTPRSYPDNQAVVYPYQTLRAKPCQRRFYPPAVEDQLIQNAPQSLTQNSFIEESDFLTPDDLLSENRRSNNEDDPIAVDNELKVEDGNCNDNDDCESRIHSATPDEVAINKKTELTSNEIEERTVELLKDCLKNKLYKSSDNENLGDSRRSLRDDENHYSRDGSEESNIIGDPSLRTGQTQVEVAGRNNKVMLTKNPRVCYACSSASNPSCWTPDRRTTIKYCNRNHASCVTKTIGEGATMTIIRDCASSCSDSPIPGIEPMYKKCSVCHSDLCNNAFSIKSYNILYILLIFTGFKYALA